MRLDPDLLREILLSVEGQSNTAELDARSQDEVNYHLAQLIEAGYVAGGIARGNGAEIADVHADDLTWDGHQLLANLRNDQVWNQTKGRLEQFGGSASIEIIEEVSSSFARRLFEIE